jgi:hypothetical protein
MSLTKFVMISLMALLIAGCGSGDGSSVGSDADTLKIGAVYTDILHQHQSFYDKWGATPNRTIRFTVSVNVIDPKGADNLSDLFVRDKVTGRKWDLLGGADDITRDECYIPDLDIYDCTFYSSISLHRVNLKNWEIVAENKQGEITSKDFEFLLPGGDSVIDEQFVYSSTHSGSTLNGIAALEAMTIADNGIKFSSNSGSQSFHIEFESMDSRATNYGFAFYDGTANIDYIGEVIANSPSIESMPIIRGQKTVIDIPWSEVSLYDSATITDINGLHIRLLDEPIERIERFDDGIWFNYESFSEFVTLSP